jgi:hypothetical protein
MATPGSGACSPLVLHSEKPILLREPMRLLPIFCVLLAVLLGFALLVSALLLLGTFAMRGVHRSRSGVLRVSHLSGLLLASAFLGFQRLVHPHVDHSMVQEVEDHDDAGDDRGPCGDPLYQRQLRRIRRGEEIDHLELVQDAEDVPR